MSAFNRIEQVTEGDVLEALRGGETDRVERTLTEKDTDGKYSEAVCAFANDISNSGKPGFLFVGVDDGGRIEGVKDAARVAQSLADIRSQGNVLPQPMLEVRFVDSDGKRVVVAVVHPADAPPVRYKGRVYIRVGPRRGIANVQEERVLSERAASRHRAWDHRACVGATLDDLGLDLFRLNYLPSAVSRDVIEQNGRSMREQLAALRMFDVRFEVPTNGAVLVFGRDPLYFFPVAYVQYVCYVGDSQASEVVQERRISGDIGTVLRQLDELAKSIERSRPIRLESMREQTVADYPWVALHELFVNAVVHRNYDGSMAPVQINQFSDRLEILNPGGLFGDLSAQTVEGATAYRNPLLAEAARVLGFANSFGLGLTKARREIEKNGGQMRVKPTSSHFLVEVGRRA
jgi:ATP-dependent DNA helicase RecG